MRDQAIWSVSLGRWNGVQLRLHMFFLLFAAFTLYLSWREEPAAADMVWIAAGSLGILLVSVVLHELGHYFAAVRFG